MTLVDCILCVKIKPVAIFSFIIHLIELNLVFLKFGLLIIILLCLWRIMGAFWLS